MKVRRATLDPPAVQAFELTGGSPALDLANTVDNRTGARPEERLRSYADLLAWSEQSGTLSAGDARRLRGAAARRPAAAETVLRRTRALREALYALFSAAAGRRTPPGDALARLNAMLPGALARLRLARHGPGFAWRFDGEDDALDVMLPPVVRAAAELLASRDDLGRVRECAAGTCAWLFLDTSRNATRRWCDMKVCGNRQKARRHYARLKRAQERAPR